MGRPALQAEAISDFRDRLCDAALELFAERGYAGFTLRALGTALGCSPTTPYTYFESKGDIYQAVCARAFEDLCGFQDEAWRSGGSPWERIRRQGRSYVAFTRANAHAYRVMFDLRDREASGELSRTEVYVAPVRRSWALLLGAFEHAQRADELDGDPARLAFEFWASIHGVMSLELQGHLFVDVPGDQLVEDIFERFERAYRPGSATTPSLSTGDPE